MNGYEYSVPSLSVYPRHPRLYLATKHGQLALWHNGKNSGMDPHMVICQGTLEYEGRAICVNAHFTYPVDGSKILLTEITIQRPNTRPPKDNIQDVLEEEVLKAVQQVWADKTVRELFIFGYNSAEDIANFEYMEKARVRIKEALLKVTKDLRAAARPTKKKVYRMAFLKEQPLPKGITVGWS